MSVANSRSGNLNLDVQYSSSADLPPNSNNGAHRKASFVSTHSASSGELSPDQTRKLKREHKAAKTLGIVMAAFLGNLHFLITSQLLTMLGITR